MAWVRELYRTFWELQSMLVLINPRGLENIVRRSQGLEQ